MAGGYPPYVAPKGNFVKHYPTASTHLSEDRVADVRQVSIGDYRTQPHEHDEYMFLLPRTGQLILNVESNASPLRVAPMSFVVVPPRRLHDTHGYRTQQEHVAVYVASDFVAYCERKAQRRLSCAKISIWSAPLPLLNAVRLATDTAQRDVGELAAYRKELTNKTLAATCVEAGLSSGHLPLTPADARRELVKDIRAFLDSTLDQSIGLDRVAYEFGLSRRTLTRMFRDVTGESIVDYQSRQRVRHASLLLQSPGMTVVMAAAAVGLDSPSYLARLFRKHGQALPRSFKA
ncbi:AraC family transcriptional regulator [Burkholderia sp. Bp9143]|uniref:AraC family transcriptional regulator n=1 Tax=Burkholderia sp. Bp9143 TaxID=2184574 RepID=UPI000F5AE08F|nr:AraC family transcriptional regulator [Burkholderia sp. Bp9143]RQR24550.1 AraC family transcriptional regulator [Burkholderia sp. Bp9143]